MGKADVNGKWLLGGEPEEWVRWMLDDPMVEVEEFLSAEFQHVLRHSDALLRVRDANGQFLLLVELQLHYDPNMVWRMQAYAALAEEKYRLPVYPLVFYLLPPSPGVRLPNRYYQEFRGLVARRDFRVVKAWELEAREMVERGPLALVPLTPLMKGADERVVRAGAQVLRERDAGEEMQVALALFASFVMSADQILEIVRWEMAVLRESPWYQEIVQEGRLEGLQEGLQKGRQEGLQKGRQEGLQKGRQEGQQKGLQEGWQKGLLEAVLQLVQARFALSGSDLDDLETQLREVNDPQVLRQLLLNTIRVENVDEFKTSLEEMRRGEDD